MGHVWRWVVLAWARWGIGRTDAPKMPTALNLGQESRVTVLCQFLPNKPRSLSAKEDPQDPADGHGTPRASPYPTIAQATFSASPRWNSSTV